MAVEMWMSGLGSRGGMWGGKSGFCSFVGSVEDEGEGERRGNVAVCVAIAKEIPCEAAVSWA